MEIETYVNLALSPGAPGAGNRAADAGRENEEGDKDDGLLVDNLYEERAKPGQKRTRNQLLGLNDCARRPGQPQPFPQRHPVWRRQIVRARRPRVVQHLRHATAEMFARKSRC